MKRSQRNAEWIEEYCRVPEGKLVGKKLKLYPPQIEMLKGIYDTPTRTAIISIGRKNGKTALSACLLLLHLVGPEAEPNSQLYSTALSRKQAALLFELAAKMVRLNPDLAEHVLVRDSAKQLLCRDLGTVYEALSAEAKTTVGTSPLFVIHDELGQVRGPRSALYEAVETGDGAHATPLSIIISTQAPTDADLLSVLIDDAEKGEDPETKLFLWSAPEEDDPWLEETWKKANPLYGLILNKRSMKKAAAAAKRMPSQEAGFRNYRLNQRINAVSPFIPKSVWKKNGKQPDIELLKTGKVYLGLDLSARIDLTALAIAVEDHERVWHVWVEFYAPGEEIAERSVKDRVPYDVWEEQGYLTTTPGRSVNYEYVARRLVDLCEEMDVVNIAFDRWKMDTLKLEIDRLLDPSGGSHEDLPLAMFGQGFKDMSPAVDSLESILANTLMRHGANPVLTWCASNTVTTTDPAGNRKLDKSKSTGRIDGIVALTMALGHAQSQQLEKPRGVSIYAEGTI